MQIRELKKLSLAALLLAVGVSSAHADDGSWVLNAPGSWNNAQNWAQNIIADGAGSTAWFTNSPVGDIAIDMDTTPRTLGALETGDPNTVAAFTLGSSDGQSLTLDGNGATARIRQRPTSKGDLVTFPLLFNSNVNLINDSPNVFTTLSETTGTGDLVIEANGAGGIIVNTPNNPTYSVINHSGKIINRGTGTGTVLFGSPDGTGEIGTNVTGVVQESPTSKLVIGYFGWYTGGATIKAGILEGQRIQDSHLSNSFGSLNYPITIGDTSGSADATLVASSYIFRHDIVVASNNTGVATITAGTGGGFSGKVTLNDHDVTLKTTSGALTMEGGFNGSGDILLAADGASAISIAGGAVNQTGNIINAGSGTATVTISTPIGENVGEVQQNSATSMLVLGGENSYQGPTTVAAGSLSIVNTAGSGTGSGAVTIQSNAVLRGTGSSMGTVTVMPGGILSPGTAAGNRGILTLGELVWQDSGIFECDVNSLEGGSPGTDYDQILTGTLTAQPNGGKLKIKLSSQGNTLPVTAGKNYTLWLMQYDSASGFDIADVEIDADNFLADGTWFVTNMYNSICYVNRDGGPIVTDPSKNCWVGSGKWSNAANWSWGHAPLTGEGVAFGSWSDYLLLEGERSALRSGRRSWQQRQLGVLESHNVPNPVTYRNNRPFN